MSMSWSNPMEIIAGLSRSHEQKRDIMDLKGLFLLYI
jgi:hypothetical protein